MDTPRDALAPICGLCSVSWCLAEGQWNGDQRRPMGRKARKGLYSLLLSLSLTMQKRTKVKVLSHRVRHCTVDWVETWLT